MKPRASRFRISKQVMVYTVQGTVSAYWLIYVYLLIQMPEAPVKMTSEQYLAVIR